jgi:hypothetical protein
VTNLRATWRTHLEPSAEEECRVATIFATHSKT